MTLIQQVSGLLFIIILAFILLFAYLDKRQRRREIADPAISFVVPCYNDGDSVGETIASIYEVVGPDVDLIVINDRSTDNSGDVLTRLQTQHGFTLLDNPENLGKSQSLNKAAALARHDIVAFVDADVVINKRALHDALIRLEKDSVGAVSCPYAPINKEFIAKMQHMEYNMLALVQGAYNIFSAMALWGGFIVIKKRAFIAAGEFSVNAITEDMDLAFKLNESGWRVEQSFFPIKTYVPDTFKKWFKQKIRWSAGGFQCLTQHFQVWIKNPIHIFFIFSYVIFTLSAVLTLGKNILLWGNMLEYFGFINETLSLLASFKLTGLLYGALIVKDILLMLAFAFFSLPYVLPLIHGIRQIHLLLLVLPFAIVYIPLFSLVSIIGMLFFLVNIRRYSANRRAW